MNVAAARRRLVRVAILFATYLYRAPIISVCIDIKVNSITFLEFLFNANIIRRYHKQKNYKRDIYLVQKNIRYLNE